MKKLIMLVVLCLALTCSAGIVTAFASQNESYAVETAKQNPKVTDAKCVIYKRGCLLALKTEKFHKKSDYDAFVDELTQQIKKNCEVDFVFVTRSPKIMFELAQLDKLDDDKKAQAIEELIQSYLNRMDDNGHRHVQPKNLQQR